MRTLNVSVMCMCTYDNTIDVPDNLTLDEAIEYAKDHIDEIDITELEYVPYSDEIDDENCSFEDEGDFIVRDDRVIG